MHSLVPCLACSSCCLALSAATRTPSLPLGATLTSNGCPCCDERHSLHTCIPTQNPPAVIPRTALFSLVFPSVTSSPSSPSSSSSAAAAPPPPPHTPPRLAAARSIAFSALPHPHPSVGVESPGHNTDVRTLSLTCPVHSSTTPHHHHARRRHQRPPSASQPRRLRPSIALHTRTRQSPCRYPVNTNLPLTLTSDLTTY